MFYNGRDTYKLRFLLYKTMNIFALFVGGIIMQISISYYFFRSDLIPCSKKYKFKIILWLTIKTTNY